MATPLSNSGVVDCIVEPRYDTNVILAAGLPIQVYMDGKLYRAVQ